MPSKKTTLSKKGTVKKKPQTVKVVKSAAKILLEKRQRRLSYKVRSIFKNMGFEYLRTDGIHKEYGNQTGELDNVFLYENIILMVEETISDHDTDHLKKKDYFLGKIKEHFTDFLLWLKTDFSSSFKKFDDYVEKHYKFFYLYTTDNVVDSQTKDNFNKLIFIDNKPLEYFRHQASTIKYTSKYDLFKFLKLDISEIGSPESSTRLTKIETAVITPDTASGFPDGVQVVTFVMMAKHLMECAYVLRKDSWDTSSGLYQRLLQRRKIENIRKFLSLKKRTFIDSIIVTLPFETSFSRKKPNTDIEESVNVFDTIQFTNISMTIPYKINTIGIIDGQHRVFSHYEGADSLESEISKLRNKRHLFVTGLFFDKSKFNESQKRKLEGEIFLQINNEQKKVNTALLQHIKSLSDPYSAVGIGKRVITNLNLEKPFAGMFSDSELISGGLRTTSILQYGLQSLVVADSESNSLYKYWIASGGESLTSEEILDNYIEFCTNSISIYFCAVKAKYPNDWKAKTSKGGMLTSTTIVAFMRSFKTSLNKYNGPKDFDFYQDKFKKLDVNFSNYVSSHWNQLSLQIDKLCWH